MLAVSQQPASWPKLMTTSDAEDLQARLSRLPFFMATDGGGVAATNAGFGAAQPASWPTLWTGGFGGVMEDLQTIVTKAPTLLGQLATIVNKAAPHMPTIVKMVEDPALPQLVQRIRTLQAIDAQKAKTAAPGAPVPTQPGVGLHRVLPLWDGAILYTKYPWAPWAIGAGAVLMLGGIGFGVGRWTKKCKTGTVGRRYRRR